MQPWFFKTLAVGLALPLLIWDCLAYPRRQAPAHGGGKEILAAALDLSAEQRQRLEQLRREELHQAIGLEAQIRLRRAELIELIDSTAPDRAALDAKIDQLGALQSELRKLTLQARLDRKAVLTPEQLARWELLQEERSRRARRAGFGCR